MVGRAPIESLLRLAEIRGIEPGFMDGSGVWVVPGTETLLAILKVLGEEIDQPEQAADRLRKARLDQMAQIVPAVVVAWIGDAQDRAVANIPITLPATGTIGKTVTLGFGSAVGQPRTVALEDCPAELSFRFDGRDWVRRFLATMPLPMGIHRLEVLVDSVPSRSIFVIVAPKRAYRHPDARGGHPDWGVFLPVHAMRSSHNHGCGDFGDLGAAMRATGRAGGTLFGTLPLLSTFLDKPIVEPSPYAPATRLFWNELYLDLQAIPEFRNSPGAQSLISRADWRAARDGLAALPLADQAAVWSLRLPLIDSICAAFPNEGERRAELEDFIRRRPKVREYAAFRARMDREGATWPTWAPGSLNQDWDDPLFKRYILCQFWADGQIAALGRNSRDWGLRGLYLDLPLGVHSDSYDTWQYKEHFARGVSAGAPPDAFFTLGQDWGFPPLHPSRIRDLGHEYFREVLDFHAAASAMLRVDHVMGLFRLYWIPWGMGPKAGAYVRYPAEELLALFCLASVRNHCSLVGEDLGTVPPAVRPAMCSRGIDRLYVAQFSIHPVNPVLDLPPDNAIACVNTHDLPPFAAFWLGTDIDDRQDLGLFDHEQAASEHADRRQLRGALLGELGLSAKDDGDGEDSTLAIDPTEVLGLLVERLRRSSCRGLLVNMEDLWAAVEPQNVPGTWKERPNWRRKAKISLDDLESSAGWKCLKKWFESAETIS